MCMNSNKVQLNYIIGDVVMFLLVNNYYYYFFKQCYLFMDGVSGASTLYQQ